MGNQQSTRHTRSSLHSPLHPVLRQIDPARTRSHPRSASPQTPRAIGLMGYMCYPGDDQYAAAAAATGTKKGEPVYWFKEYRASSRPHDEVWDNSVAAARDSESRSRERKKTRSQRRDALKALNDIGEKTSWIRRTSNSIRRKIAHAGRKDEEVAVEDGQDTYRGKGKGKMVGSKEVKIVEPGDGVKRRDSTMATYRRDMDESVARAMVPAFSVEFAETLKRLGSEE